MELVVVCFRSYCWYRYILYYTNMKTQNSEVLKDFVKYADAHPRERFWQALRNWSGFAFVRVNNTLDPKNNMDTFYWEGKNK